MTKASEVSREELTDAQLEILDLIRENPGATQKEFADQLDITAAAVGSRVRQIPGMNWMNRRQFVQEFYSEDENSDGNTTEPGHNGHSIERMDELQKRLASVEEELDTLSTRVNNLIDERSDTGVKDPDLVRKLVLTLTNSDRFTDDEADRLLATLIKS